MAHKLEKRLIFVAFFRFGTYRRVRNQIIPPLNEIHESRRDSREAFSSSFHIGQRLRSRKRGRGPKNVEKRNARKGTVSWWNAFYFDRIILPPAEFFSYFWSLRGRFNSFFITRQISWRQRTRQRTAFLRDLR